MQGGKANEGNGDGSVDASLDSLTEALGAVSLGKQEEICGDLDVGEMAESVSETDEAAKDDEWPCGWEGSSKLRRLVEDVHDMLRKDETAKCVCFSQVRRVPVVALPS
jgi:hypothetical protein